MVTFASFLGLSEVIGEIGPNQILSRDTGNLDRALVDVSDFTLGADGHQRIQAGFNQAARILGSLFLCGDVADSAGDQDALLGLQRAEADLHLELGSVLALAVQLQARTHGTRPGFAEEAGPVSGMGAAEALWNEDFDRLIEQFLALVTEQFLGLSVHQDDKAVLIDNDDSVRGSFE